MVAGERTHQTGGRRRDDARTLFALGLAVIAALAFASIGYLLRPSWTGAPPAVDAPPLPIVVAGIVFNVPPAAIRIPIQRHAGPQERIDLVYQSPQLTPPSAASAAAPDTLLFVTIERLQDTLTPAERLKSIYPRYIEDSSPLDATGLVIARFRDGSPYAGEDVLYDPAHPDRFLVRCNRARHELVWAMCLFPRPAGSAALTFRFPRTWLGEWRDVQERIERLIASWRPAGK
jgi:hypothetical protein